jgi:hypothetical protein
VLPTELSEDAWKWVLKQGLSTHGEELAKLSSVLRERHT